MAVKKVNQQISFGQISLPGLKGGIYNVNVKVYGDTKQNTGFTISLYSQVAKMKFESVYYVYSEQLARARRLKSKRIYEDTADHSTISAFVNHKLNLLNLELKKTKKEDIHLTIQVETTDNKFPEHTLSNSDWKNGVKKSKVKMTLAGNVTITYF